MTKEIKNTKRRIRKIPFKNICRNRGRHCVRLIKLLWKFALLVFVGWFLYNTLFLQQNLVRAVADNNQIALTNFRISQVKVQNSCLVTAQQELLKQEKIVTEAGKKVTEEQKKAFAQDVYNRCLNFEGWGFLVKQPKVQNNSKAQVKEKKTAQTKEKVEEKK